MLLYKYTEKSMEHGMLETDKTSNNYLPCYYINIYEIDKVTDCKWNAIIRARAIEYTQYAKPNKKLNWLLKMRSIETGHAYFLMHVD